MGAYRPARFIGNREGAPQLSVGDVTCILASATNCQGHLTPFVYPKHGYAVRLQAESGATEKSFNQAALGQCATIYQLPPSRELSPRNLAHEVLKILNGNSLQTDAAFIMAYVVEHSEANSDLASLIREVRESGSIEGPGKHTRELRLIFGDAFEDALEKLLPSIASSIELTPKIARLVQQLSSTPSRAATPQQLETLLALEIPKVFSRERALLRTSPSGADEYSGDSLRMYLTKVSHAFMARSSTALCTTLDTWSWNNPNFLQMVMVDHGAGRVVGNIQIHLTQDAKGERALLARLNPTEAFVDKVDKTALARGMLSVVQQFADDNNLPAYLAEQGDYRMLTNRNSFLPFLEAYFGERHEVVTQVTGSTFQNVRAMYRIRREKLWQEK
jgi:hypothetical protein